ncbi:MAG: UbiD family decarboxylase associated with menaquinone via futalosine [Myxococcaceae bacterium]|nr:UbiD family decarboxylase associated with menaquinone via futalosine [Myxococcaceae bacterium]
MAGLVSDVGDARGTEHALAVRSMFDRISPTYDLLNRLMSAGIDKRWRKLALDRLAQRLPDGPLLDSCAGTLDLAAAMETRFFSRRVLAADFAREMLVRGRSKVSRAPVMVGDAMRLPVQDGVLAGMTCAFGMRNLASPEAGLREAMRVLKPGGVFVVLEFYRPSTMLMRAFHAVYARFVLPGIGSLISRDKEAYAYLARSMQGFYSRDEFTKLARDVGFTEVSSEDLSFGIASLFRLVKG